jgi:hypothetical protein
MFANWKRISLALGLLAVASSVPTSAPAQAPRSPNQQTADAVAGALRSGGSLADVRIAIDTQDGLVVLSGSVTTEAQKAEALARARSVPGVLGVADRLIVASDPRVRPARFEITGRPAQPMAGARPGQPPRMAFGGNVPQLGGVPSVGGPYGGAVGAPYGGGVTSGPIEGATMGPIGSYEGGMGIDGPAPEGLAGGATAAAMPGAPNYAWPSYAPHPNFSAVGYPTAYPWQAWPNIGPFYPYPEVPLDWRAVTLRWDDGIWWLDFKKHYTRPFFTPYPFGIFGY